MASTTPSRLGPYEIVAPLGAGAMGEVYRARDVRLNREVAIKVLGRTGLDSHQHGRLLGEAQAASALNHPNILTVFDVGDAEGTPFIVSELVDGVSLRTVLLKAPLPIRQVLDLGIQMADGLAAAHQAGIVHRDFKPENVMVTRDGRVKIVDFGLALVGVSALPQADVTMTLTQVKGVVGTVPYMSPEQARGAAVDCRADQFALGLTLYEMVTGRRAFAAETPAQVIAAIIEHEPEPIGAINPRVPAPLRWVIERCLVKDPRERYESTVDLARDLRTLRDRLPELAPGLVVDRAAAAPRRWTPVVVFVALVAAAAAMVWTALSDTDASFASHKFTPFATDSGYQGSAAWSRDGKTIVYVAEVDSVLQLFTKSLGSSMRAQVTHNRFDCHDPFWSTDGTRLYYVSLAREREGLWSISAVGGEPELVLESVSRAALSPDGKTLAFYRGESNDVHGFFTLWFSSPPGSQPTRYTRKPYGDRGFASATLHFSPDGSKLGAWGEQFWVENSQSRLQFWVIPMRDEDPSVSPAPALHFPGDAPQFNWLPDSRHIVTAFRPVQTVGFHLWWMDTERPSGQPLTVSSTNENDPALTADGSRIAMSVQESDYDIVQFDLDRSSPLPLLATSRNEADPAWSPSGGQMAFVTDRSGRDEIWLRSQNGEWERPLVTPRDFDSTSQTWSVSSPVFSPDGQRVAYGRLGTEGSRIWISPLAGGPPVLLSAVPAAQLAPNWSPDGAWIAYVQGLVGEFSLAKARVGTTPKSEVIVRDIAPQSMVAWSPDGAWIAYVGKDGMAIVSPDGKSHRLIQEIGWFVFAWSADSRRLYGIRQSDDSQHLTFTSVDVRTAAERVLGPSFMPLPASGVPVSGFARISPTRFATSIVHVRSDIWLLDGFQPPSTWRDRAAGLFFRGR